MRYLYARYGAHPALYRAARSTQYGPNESPRSLFFVCDMEIEGWAPALDTIRGTAHDAIVLARTDDAKMFWEPDVLTQLAATHADGLWKYSVIARGSRHDGVPALAQVRPTAPMPTPVGAVTGA